jgi:hypothetical protein
VELDVFLPVRESDVQGVERELSLRTAWARVGPRISWKLLPLCFGASAYAGPALVWASARTDSPRLIGTTEWATAVVIAGGAWLESPDSAPVYVRASSYASRLIPRIDLELGDGSAHAFGDLFLEMSLAVGARW